MFILSYLINMFKRKDGCIAFLGGLLVGLSFIMSIILATGEVRVSKGKDVVPAKSYKTEVIDKNESYSGVVGKERKGVIHIGIKSFGLINRIDNKAYRQSNASLRITERSIELSKGFYGYQKNLLEAETRFYSERMQATNYADARVKTIIFNSGHKSVIITPERKFMSRTIANGPQFVHTFKVDRYHELMDDEGARLVYTDSFDEFSDSRTKKALLIQLLQYATEKKEVIDVYIEMTNGFSMIASFNGFYMLDGNLVDG